MNTLSKKIMTDAFREFKTIIEKNGGFTVNQFIRFIEPKQK